MEDLRVVGFHQCPPSASQMLLQSCAGSPRPHVRQIKLLGLDWVRHKDPSTTLGLASISSHLISKDIPYEVRSFAVNSPTFRVDAVVDWALQGLSGRGKDTCLGLGAFVWAEAELQTILRGIRGSGFQGLIVLGGPQVTYTSPHSTQSLEELYPQADAFVRGYGEPAFPLLATHTDAQLRSRELGPALAAAGVHPAGAPDAGAMAQVDLEELASPMLSGTLPPHPFMRWELQRGCPYRCAFCQHREGEGSFSRQRRQFSSSRIMQEVKWICSHPEIQDIAVVDPTFNTGPHYMQVLEALKLGGYRGKLSLQCRFELINPGFLEAVSNHSAHIVLEFGLQTTNPLEATLIHRPNCMPAVERAMRQLGERGITYEVSIIYGLPGQTLESFSASLAFCHSMGAPTVRSWPLMLLRGTSLHTNKAALGLVESHELGVDISEKVGSGIPHVVASPTFTYQEWQQMWAMAQERG